MQQGLRMKPGKMLKTIIVPPTKLSIKKPLLRQNLSPLNPKKKLGLKNVSDLIFDKVDVKRGFSLTTFLVITGRKTMNPYAKMKKSLKLVLRKFQSTSCPFMPISGNFRFQESRVLIH